MMVNDNHLQVVLPHLAQGDVLHFLNRTELAAKHPLDKGQHLLVAAFSETKDMVEVQDDHLFWMLLQESVDLLQTRFHFVSKQTMQKEDVTGILPSGNTQIKVANPSTQLLRKGQTLGQGPAVYDILGHCTKHLDKVTD